MEAKELNSGSSSPRSGIRSSMEKTNNTKSLSAQNVGVNKVRMGAGIHAVIGYSSRASMKHDYGGARAVTE